MLQPPHPFLVETDWLAEHLDEPALRVVDCRYYYDGRDPRALFHAGHIPGAVYADRDKDLYDAETEPPNLVPRPERMAAAMRRLGVSNDTLVVGYDDEGGHVASRLWWDLRYYGHDHVRILNGGLIKWLAEGRPLQAGAPPVPPGAFQPGPPRRSIRATRDEVLAALDDARTRLLDVRRLSEYTGEEVRAKRVGRIPGAVHLLWQENLNDDWTFKSPEEIRWRHERAGITPAHCAITY